MALRILAADHRQSATFNPHYTRTKYPSYYAMHNGVPLEYTNSENGKVLWSVVVTVGPNYLDPYRFTFQGPRGGIRTKQMPGYSLIGDVREEFNRIVREVGNHFFPVE